jgi:hypothetical protein
MKSFLKLLLVSMFFVCVPSFAIDNISVDKIEIYTDKSKILDLGTGGASIPANVKVAVLRTTNQTYSGWKFVAYGDSLDQILSVWLAARAMNKPISCNYEDRGAYWVQCVGVGF